MKQEVGIPCSLGTGPLPPSPAHLPSTLGSGLLSDHALEQGFW